MKAKRTYKDSLFRHIFNDKKRLASLYKALTGETISLRDIRITTLSGVFYNDIKKRHQFQHWRSRYHPDGTSEFVESQHAAADALVSG